MEIHTLRIGELAGLGAAFIWAMTSIAFTRAGRASSPVAVNAFKTIAGTFLFAAALTLRDGNPWAGDAAPRDLLFLALSGFLGLSIGDSLLFKGFVTFGTRRAMLVFSLNPVLGAAGGYLFLGERIPALSLAGMAIALGGVALVIGERRPAAPDGLSPPRGGREKRPGGAFHAGRRATLLGVLFSLGAGSGQAGGALLAKSSLQRVETLTATFVRMAAGAAGLVLIGLATGRLRRWSRGLGDRALLGRIALASLFGPFVGVYLMIFSVQNAPTGIALTLLSTSPIWLLPLGAWIEKDPPSAREVIGALIAIAGVALLVLR